MSFFLINNPTRPSQSRATICMVETRICFNFQNIVIGDFHRIFAWIDDCRDTQNATFLVYNIIPYFDFSHLMSVESVWSRFSIGPNPLYLAWIPFGCRPHHHFIHDDGDFVYGLKLFHDLISIFWFYDQNHPNVHSEEWLSLSSLMDPNPCKVLKMGGIFQLLFFNDSL